MQLLEAGWRRLGSERGQAALQYLGELYSGLTHTLQLENGFNDLRNNERRAAKHKARSEQSLQSVAVMSQVSRMQKTGCGVAIDPEDVSAETKTHVRKGSKLIFDKWNAIVNIQCN